MRKMNGIGGASCGVLICAVLLTGWGSFERRALAADRQFLVIPANSPKQFADTNGLPPDGLPTPESIRKRYFSDVDSVAAYWEEISYGAVTLSGDVTGWVTLPWAIQLQLDLDEDEDFYFDLNQSGIYEYGSGERINTFNAMVGIDTNGAAPGGVVRAGIGSQHISDGGLSVWKPGERFVDMDGDGAWDALDEARNEMDANPKDMVLDGPGPWTDLNLDGEPENPSEDCIYLQDANNDGSPDCCPSGPYVGNGSTNIFCACPATIWDGPTGEVTDCNGNTVPDICEVCGTTAEACRETGWLGRITGLEPSRCLDDVPEEAPETAPDGIPAECQFDLNNCDPVAGCPEISLDLPDRCEFFDANDSSDLDIVEPYENFIRRWNPFVGWVRASEQYIRDNYPARQDDIESLIREQEGRVVFGLRDPNEVTGPGCECPDGITCSTLSFLQQQRMDDIKAMYGIGDGDFPADFADRTYCVVVRTCVDNGDCDIGGGFGCELIQNVGVGYCNNGQCPGSPGTCRFQPVLISEYNPPDEWEDVVATDVGNDVPLVQTFSTKLQQTDFDDFEDVTPKPDWFDQAWRDRYPTTAPTQGVPNWIPGSVIPVVDPFDVNDAEPDVSLLPKRAATRRFFDANAGGANGDGTGWVGCDNEFDSLVAFRTLDQRNDDPISFEELCDNPILPEEMNGVGEPAVVYDGWVEHDDVPSSKYHRAGDQRFGEVTSPATDNFYGQDRGLGEPGTQSIVDGIIAAAGPLASNVHGTNGFDAGNVMSFELLTWRTHPPFNSGLAWQSEHSIVTGREPDELSPAFHPYAPTLGFRDFNLDGLIDQGETRFAGTENYVRDAFQFGVPGVDSAYPFNRIRIIEDCIEALDHLLDFDDFLDPGALAARECAFRETNEVPERAPTPTHYQFTGSPFSTMPTGILSGTVLLPTGSHDAGEFSRFPRFVPVHTEDVRDDAKPELSFPFDPMNTRAEHINWNMFTHTSVNQIPPGNADPFRQVAVTNDFLNAWEFFPDLTDQDSGFGAIINTPLGNWEIMAEGGLVHSIPILKEKSCTRWIEPVDLTTILTPGVEASITIPPYEEVRGSNAIFLENSERLGERYYFYSVGSGLFDPVQMPGNGMLVLHTDVGSNPDVLPPSQTDPTRFNYVIVQADGEGRLEAGDCDPLPGGGQVCGDDGDPWPGSTGKRTFNRNTIPSATWYSLNAWTGLNVSDISHDVGSGSTLLTLTWTPTSLPSLAFVDPPGGASVNGIYRVLMDVTDVFGGTTVEIYRTQDPQNVSINSNLVGSVTKSSSGTSRLTANWDVRGLANGRYFLFAKLIPGSGADGDERSFSRPRANRNNIGDGMVSLATCGNGDPCVSDTDCPNSEICAEDRSRVNLAGNKARLETWVAEVVKRNATSPAEWLITSSLSQRLESVCSGDSTTICLNDAGCPAGQSCVAQQPDPCMLAELAPASQEYTSCDGEVTITLTRCVPNGNDNPDWCPADAKSLVPGDSFSFTTTGITAASRSVTIQNGEVRENPTARIVATPLTVDPGGTVQFDARLSTDPNGLALTYEWKFGDGAQATGERVSHIYQVAGQFTVTLKATNTNGRFGEAAVDIQVINEKPVARVEATPTAGPAPLVVQLNSSGSTDKETSQENLIYQWDFGDGQTANQNGIAGILRSTSHTYDVDENNPACTEDCGCTYVATVLVTDADGAQDTASVEIKAGNSRPVANVRAVTPLNGASPLTVTLNAQTSTDADEDQELAVTWEWGDGETETLPLDGTSGNGNVSHTYTRRATDEGASEFTLKVTVSDGCTNSVAQQFTIQVNEGLDEPSRPIADFEVSNSRPRPGQVITVDASRSRDRPDATTDLTFAWDWGDGGTTAVAADGTIPSECIAGNINRACSIATHSYDEPGTYRITLTVTDDEDPPNTAATARDVTVTAEGGGPDDEPNRRPNAVIVVNRMEGVAGVTEFIFDARNSSDPDEGDSLEFMWDFRDRPETGPVVARVFENPGTQVVTLTVVDRAGARDEARVTITLTVPTVNQLPVAAIGTGRRSGSAGVTLTFDGQASYDPDGDPLTYRWEIIRNGVLLQELDGAVIEFTFAQAGDYQIVLEVSDGIGAPVQAEPEMVRVTARATPPANDNDNAVDDGEGRDIPDSAAQRPGVICGVGMLGGFVATFLGLSALRFSRRRRS